MIQRIQTVYLILSSLMSGLLAGGNILNFSSETGEKFSIAFKGLQVADAGQIKGSTYAVWLMESLILLIPVLSLVTIFLYKNRKLQLIITRILIVLSMMLIIDLSWISFSVISKLYWSFNPGVKMILPILILLCSLLAFRAIKSDDKLVKSYDRLR